MNHPEFQEQCAFFEWLKIKYPEAYDVSNASAAGEIRCSIQKAVRLKKMGVKAGWPDIFIAMPIGNFAGMFIEMKGKKGKLTKEQILIGEKLTKQHYYWVVAHGWEEAANLFESYYNYITPSSMSLQQAHEIMASRKP